MAFLFVPLSGLTLGGLKGADVGQAAGITNMVRQIGGSISVAVIGVLNETLSAEHRAVILEHVTPDNPLLSERVNMLKNGMLSMTTDVDKATQQALAYINYTVDKQAAILSYIDIFHYLTLFVFISIPLIFFAKTYKLNQDAMSGH